MGDYGIKVTLPGKSITSTDTRDYQFWSKYPIMKTYLVGTTNYTFPSYLSTVNIVITHNLGHAKCVWFSFDGSNINSRWKGNDILEYFTGSWPSNFVYFNWSIRSDTDSLTINYNEVHGGSGHDTTGETWYFKYYLFIENST